MADRLFILRPTTPNVGNDLIAIALDALLRDVWPGELDLVTVPAAVGLDAATAYDAGHLADGVVVGGGNLLENGALRVSPTALDALRVPLGVLAISSGRVYGRDGHLTSRTDRAPEADVRALCEPAAPLLVRDLSSVAGLTTSMGDPSPAVCSPARKSRVSMCPTLRPRGTRPLVSAPASG